MRLSRVLGGSGRLIAASLVFALAQAALLVPAGLLVRHLFDHEIPAGDTSGVAWAGALIALVVVLSAAVAMVARHVVLRATKEAIGRLRVRLARQLYSLPLGWFDDVEEGALHATVVQDSERLDQVNAGVVAQLLPAATIAAALGAALLVVAPVLALVAFLAVPVSWLASRAPNRALGRRSRRFQETFDRFSTRMLRAIGAPAALRADGAHERELDSAGAEIAALSEAGRALFWLQFASTQLASAAAGVIGVAVLVVGAGAVARGDMTLGTLVAFYALALPLRGQLATILTVLPTVVSGGEWLRRLEAVLDAAPPAPYAGTRPPPSSLRVVLEDVTFGYRQGSPVLRGLDLDLPEGAVVGLAGPNGAGKTTLAELVLGLRRPDAGRLLAGGIPYDQLDPILLRERMALVAQAPLLLSGTVAQNIAFSVPGATRADIAAAATLATADEVVARLPGGLDSTLGEHGKRLSGGEAQRIALARAFLRRPSLLILDEPTTHLDSDSVQRLLSTLSALEWGPAVLLISHDEGVLECADFVYRLVDGGALVR